ncbi:ATP-binding cassette domain-containing protein, partial [Pseudomonas sp. MAFF 311095]|uniref:ATP-binding cassette domain-containing protein n=1 Tax=Pseudomonas petroselini TaxID=2899822 RepID=UPI0020B2D875
MTSPPSHSPTQSVLLRLDDISLSFKGIKAITSISFDVKAGDICGLIGPNGAGKSSLLNVINGVYHPQSGTVPL